MRRSSEPVPLFPLPPSGPMMPMCAECVDDGGLTLFGTKVPVRRAVLHPDHQFFETDRRGDKTSVLVAGPPRPLCGHHVELSGWLAVGKAKGYPPPPWSVGGRSQYRGKDVQTDLALDSTAHTREPGDESEEGI